MGIVVHLVKAVLINGSKRLIKILYTVFFFFFHSEPQTPKIPQEVVFVSVVLF